MWLCQSAVSSAIMSVSAARGLKTEPNTKVKVNSKTLFLPLLALQSVSLAEELEDSTPESPRKRRQQPDDRIP